MLFQPKYWRWPKIYGATIPDDKPTTSPIASQRPHPATVWALPPGTFPAIDTDPIALFPARLFFIHAVVPVPTPVPAATIKRSQLVPAESQLNANSPFSLPTA